MWFFVARSWGKARLFVARGWGKARLFVARGWGKARLFVARELAPAGARSGPVLCLKEWDCCAVQREQAPSPQGLMYVSRSAKAFCIMAQVFIMAGCYVWFPLDGRLLARRIFPGVAA
jgi:hypothetical protein